MRCSGDNAGGNGGATGSSSLIGQRCLKDSDCGTQGLICLEAAGDEFNGGGVSNGVCSVDCSADLTAVVSTDSTCFQIDKSSICLQITPAQAYCVESCTPGAPDATEQKCHNRKDMACADPRDQGLGYCKPTCRGNFDCGSRVCDLADGTCVDKIDPSRKLPIGTKCDPNADVDPCQGACVGIVTNDSGTADIGFCSGFCKLGEQNGCGFDPQAKTVDAFCLYQTSQAADFGDLGFCGQVCDCNDDCLSPDFICTAVNGLSDLIGRGGACGPRQSASEKGIACTGSRPKPDSGKPPVTVPEAGPGPGPGPDAAVGVPDAVAPPPPPADAAKKD